MAETETDTLTLKPRRPRAVAVLPDGDEIRLLRGLSGMSQREFAAKAGISLSALGGAERNLANTYPGTLRKIAAALRVPVKRIARAPDDAGAAA